MNIVQKVKSRGIAPGHNNYQEVTIDAAGDGPIINFDGVHTRNSGLPGFSPIKQTSSEYEKTEENKNAPKKNWLDRVQTGLDIGGFIPGLGVALDLGNAAISLGRAGYSKYKGTDDWKDHLINAGASGVASIPGLDYLATGAKVTNKIAKANKARKGLQLGKNTRVSATLDPLDKIIKSPKQSMFELGLGGAYVGTGGFGQGDAANPFKDTKSSGVLGTLDHDAEGDPPPVVEVENDDKEKKKKKPSKPSYGESWKKAWAPK